MPQIDTIKLTTKATPERIAYADHNCDKLQKLCSSGEVVWERRWKQSCLPSSFGGIRISYSDAASKIANGIRNARDNIEYEFSLAKWQSPYGYNHLNGELSEDIAALKRWIDDFNVYTGLNIGYDEWELARVDLAVNYDLTGGTPQDFLHDLELKMSQYPEAQGKMEKYKGCVYYPSSWLTKKIYWKGLEWRAKERPKYRELIKNGYLEPETAQNPLQEAKLKLLGRKYEEENAGKKPIPADEIKRMQTQMRMEIEFRRDYLHRHGYTNIDSIIHLQDRFHEESAKWLTVGRLREVGQENLSLYEERLVSWTKRYGPKSARDQFVAKHGLSRFYRVRKLLRGRGIYVEMIDNADFRAEITREDKCMQYELRIAA